MIAEKKHRTDLAVPPIVREQWEKGTREKDEMAQLLQDTNWDKDLQLTTQSLCQFAYNIY